MIPELAHQLGLVPLATLGVLLIIGRRVDPAYWWLALAFGVSWVADTAAHWIAPSLVSVVYPVSQAGIVVAVLMPRPYAMWTLGVLISVAVAGVLLRGVSGPEIVIRAVAWGAVIAALIPSAIPVRGSLLVYYGLGLVAWIGYVALPGWTTWGVYQGTRAVGIGGFCLHLVRSKP